MADPTARKTKAWIKAFVANNRTLTPAELIARHIELADQDLADPPPTGWSDPWIIGQIHELAVSEENRKSRGAWYTPRELVEQLSAWAFRQCPYVPDLVLDPTCGGGAFLLAGLDQLVGLGLGPEQAALRIRGMDLDDGAVHATRCSLKQWARSHGIDHNFETQILQGDALIDLPAEWNVKRLVIGNPPFATPLKGTSVASAVEKYRKVYSETLGAYADLAVLHVDSMLRNSPAGSVVMMIMPQSVLSTQHLSSWRQMVNERAPTIGLWLSTKLDFAASVRTCATLHSVGGSPASISVVVDNKTARELIYEAKWSQIACNALGVPVANLASSNHLGEFCQPTAGFRDEYYGMAEACVEWSGSSECDAKLLTSGAVHLLSNSWGQKQIRFAKQKWSRPWIDPQKASAKTRKWLERQQQPKILLATQSKVLKPVIDIDGTLIGSTPLIIIETDQLFRVAAALLAPVLSLHAYRLQFGSAMSADAIKLSATQVQDLPAPLDLDAWDEAASSLEQITMDGNPITTPQLLSLARLGNAAYRAGPESLEWWLGRI